MIRLRDFASFILLGALAVASAGVKADDYVVLGNGIATPRIGDRCAQFGAGYTDLGSGVCGRVTRHVRVYVNPGNVVIAPSANAWPTNGTANAAMHADGMVPSAMITRLPVRGGLDGDTPYR